jgi:hypothetical protein
VKLSDKQLETNNCINAVKFRREAKKAKKELGVLARTIGGDFEETDDLYECMFMNMDLPNMTQEKADSIYEAHKVLVDRLLTHFPESEHYRLGHSFRSFRHRKTNTTTTIVVSRKISKRLTDFKIAHDLGNIEDVIEKLLDSHE